MASGRYCSPRKKSDCIQPHQGLVRDKARWPGYIFVGLESVWMWDQNITTPGYFLSDKEEKPTTQGGDSDASTTVGSCILPVRWEQWLSGRVAQGHEGWRNLNHQMVTLRRGWHRELLMSRLIRFCLFLHQDHNHVSSHPLWLILRWLVCIWNRGALLVTWPRNVPPDIKTHHRINIGNERSLTSLTKLVIYRIKKEVGILKIKNQTTITQKYNKLST